MRLLVANRGETAIRVMRAAAAYEQGNSINTASHFEIDDVIDPAESRNSLTRALKSVRPAPPRTGKKRPNVDTW